MYEPPKIGIRGCKAQLGGQRRDSKLNVSTEIIKWMEFLSRETSISNDILSDWTGIFRNPHSTFRHILTCLTHYIGLDDVGQGILAGWNVTPGNAGKELNASFNYDSKQNKANSPIHMREWNKSLSFFSMGKSLMFSFY